MSTIILDRTTTWSAIGKSVEECKDLDCVLKTSGLDYTVSKIPVYKEDEDGYHSVPHRFLTQRDDGSKDYDIVSDRFTVIQNRDAFDFVNYMGDELRFEKAGETYNGMVYIIGVLPQVSILGDAFTPHVIFRNGFSGNVKITAAICPLRFVCRNQFNFAFRNTRNAVTIRHMKNAEQKLAEARDVLKMSADYMARLNDMAKEYAGIKLSSGDLDRVLDQMFPMTNIGKMKPYQVQHLEEQRQNFRTAYFSDDNSNHLGTAWGLVNAYTDFITHEAPQRNTKTKEDSKFMTVTFAPGLMNAILRGMSAVGIH